MRPWRRGPRVPGVLTPAGTGGPAAALDVVPAGLEVILMLRCTTLLNPRGSMMLPKPNS